MENEFNKIEKIDRYLGGHLTPTDQIVFENELATDTELAREVELIKAAKNAVIHAGRVGLKNKLDQFEKEVETPVRRIIPFRWMAAVAAVLVLLVAGIWFSKNNSSASPQQLFAEHFEVYRNPILIRGGENISENNWQAATEAYARGDYGKADSLFQQSLNDSLTVNYLAHYYRGICLLAQPLPDAVSAISEFDEVLKSDTDYRLQAMWYKGLGLSRVGDVGAAKMIFEEIRKVGGYKEKELDEILEWL